MKANPKIKNIKNLTEILQRLKKKNKRIILCHGVFDLLHPGHIRHLKDAKSRGDYLVVSITKDEFIKKGFNRPVFNTKERLLSIAALEDVDYVCESPTADAIKVIKNLKPNYYIKGSDYKNLSLDDTNKIKLEKKTVEKIKGKILFTKTPIYSSSKILFDTGKIFTDTQKNYLDKISKNINLQKFKDILKRIQNLKVLVIGETIIDKYTFSQTIGKASKDPILVIKEKNDIVFLGGAASVAQNIKGICRNVDFLSEIGPEKIYKSFINKKLKNVNKIFINRKNSSTIVKKRYVDEISNRKLLGVYNIDNSNIKKANNKIYNFLKQNIKKYDLIVVSDYGHGLIDNKISQMIVKKANNIFLNCQLNSNNIGFHSMKRYKGSKNVIINETELRYEMRDNSTDISSLIKKFCSDNKFKNLIVTQGINGAILYEKNKQKFTTTPAFAVKVIDKVGTGDVMLSVISLFFAATKNHEVGVLAGSMFASKSLLKFGNEDIVSVSELKKFFSTFLN
tara:strand:+ start:123 stop:1646 length:1524 start_codon:yes stop_codon:yes gene_type:complete